MELLFLLVTLGQTPPATPSPAYPSSEGAVRDRYARVSLSAPPDDVTRTVFEFRRRDGGTFDCGTPGTCPVRTTTPFHEVTTDTLPDDFWCFRGRYENDAGTSAFSSERCYLDDKTPPPQPTYVDAGLVNGLAIIDYVGLDDVGPAPSLVGAFCARAQEETNGDTYGPYCGAGPWGRVRTPDAGNFFAYTLRLPLPPGTWKVGVMANDRASYGSPVRWGPVFTIAEEGLPPPPPFWRETDGGVAPDDSWTRDQYLSRSVFPGVAGHQGAIIQKRDENGPWETVSTLLGMNGSTAIYVRPGVVRKQVRYSVVNADGGASPWSSALNVRLDMVPPAALSNCSVSVTPGASTIEVAFSGGVDALSTSSFSARLTTSEDGGVLAFALGGGGGSFVAPDGVYRLSVVARDEAGNSTALECGAAVAIPGPFPDAGTEDGGVEPPDAGTDVNGDGGPSPAPRDLAVGCACSDASGLAPWLGFFAVLLTRRARRGTAANR